MLVSRKTKNIQINIVEIRIVNALEIRHAITSFIYKTPEQGKSYKLFLYYSIFFQKKYGYKEKGAAETTPCVKKLTNRIYFLYFIFQNKESDYPKNINEKEKMADGIIDTDTNQDSHSQRSSLQTDGIGNQKESINKLKNSDNY